MRVVAAALTGWNDLGFGSSKIIAATEKEHEVSRILQVREQRECQGPHETSREGAKESRKHYCNHDTSSQCSQGSPVWQYKCFHAHGFIFTEPSQNILNELISIF